MEFRDNDKNFSLTLEMMVGQVFIFFIAGYESSAATMCHALFEMCHNPEIQRKARLEILKVIRENNNEITYDSLNQMKYTKQIIYGKF